MPQQLPIEYTLQPIRDAVDSDPEMLQQIVGMLITSTQENLAAIKKAVTDQDANALRYRAHLLKGTLLQIEAKKLAMGLQQLEDFAQVANVPAAAGIWPEVEQQLNDFLSSVMQELQQQSA
jgi:HPt (histidine-containing phosphotransfer) domain-containing protein